jgi:hypothetical protein
LQNKVVAWRNQKLKGATLEGTLKHLEEEFEHLKSNPYDPLHIADIFILMMSLSEFVDFSMDEVATAISAKIAINENRSWKAPDEKGIIRHIEDTEIS